MEPYLMTSSLKIKLRTKYIDFFEEEAYVHAEVLERNEDFA
jgi:hypothetical protein